MFSDVKLVALEDYAPAWLVNFVLGPRSDRLRAFAAAHPEVWIITGHKWLDFFDSQPPWQASGTSCAWLRHR